jgi:hypothetical protein
VPEPDPNLEPLVPTPAPDPLVPDPEPGKRPAPIIAPVIAPAG